MTNHPNRNRKIKVEFTQAEWRAVLWAIGNMTSGNANDLDEMVLCGMTIQGAKALSRAEQKMEAAKNGLAPNGN